MTEDQWLACADPAPMFDHLEGKIGQRALRLFAYGCCRRIRTLLRDERLRGAVEAMEKFVAGNESPDEVRQAKSLASAAFQDILDDASEQRWYYVEKYAAEAVCLSLGDDLTLVMTRRVAELSSHALSLAQPGDEGSNRRREAFAQAALLRDALVKAR